MKRGESCPVCGQGKEPDKIVFEDVKEICGREGRRVFVFQPVKSQELELETYLERIRKMSYQIVARGELGFTFKGSTIKGSILKSGLTILEGINNAEEARKIYNQIYENL